MSSKKKERKLIASGKIKVAGSFKCGVCGKVVVNPEKELKCPYCNGN